MASSWRPPAARRNPILFQEENIVGSTSSALRYDAVRSSSVTCWLVVLPLWGLAVGPPAVGLAAVEGTAVGLGAVWLLAVWSPTSNSVDAAVTACPRLV